MKKAHFTDPDHQSDGHRQKMRGPWFKVQTSAIVVGQAMDDGRQTISKKWTILISNHQRGKVITTVQKKNNK